MVADINKVSNPTVVRSKFAKYKGNDNAKLELSEKPDKKYKVIHNGKTTHFGSTMADFTKHGDEVKRKSYLARSAGIKGDWATNKYSPNNLARNLLW
jgi:uncharacterized membrane protein YvbJ